MSLHFCFAVGSVLYEGNLFLCKTLVLNEMFGQWRDLFVWNCASYAQGKGLLVKRVAGRGPPPSEVRSIKRGAGRRGSKDERGVLSVWPLQLCYRGAVYHGAKWQRWKLANPAGSMREFHRARKRKAAEAREEIRAFWRRHEATTAGAGADPLASCAESAPPHAVFSSDSSSESLDELEATQGELARLLASGASDEELLEWATRREEWDFVP